MNQQYEPGYDPDYCKDTEPEEARLERLGIGPFAEPEELLPCRFCEKPVTDADFAESDQDDAHQACIDDNYDGPGEVDYDAVSLRERLELHHRIKERLR